MARKHELQLYNSMTKQKEAFKPKAEGKVGMYVCGVTAYDLSHIGHARAYVAFDVLYRFLKHLQYDVTYVRNFTDVDDKIIKKANELGEENPLLLSKKFCEEFLVDMAALQCLPPTYQPSVSEHMEDIKDMIAQIINNGCAYQVEGGDVYFSVDNSPNYGQLSGRRLEDNIAGKRVAVDSRKKNPADFALWKAAKTDEPYWDSPWGRGRPGWHIECSAMSAKYLGYSFDIHGGGMDLIFPHHENELAQSCAACPETNVGYWVHNGFVTMKDQKMSKSLGNFFTIREVTNVYHPLALRHFLMSSHYRSPLYFSPSQLDFASEAVFYMYQTLQDCEDAVSSFRQADRGAESSGKTAQITPAAKGNIDSLRSDFETRLADDLHTPDILNGALQETFKLMNNYLTMLKKNQQKQLQLAKLLSLIELQKEVKEVLDVLGLLSSLTSAEVLQQLKEKALIRAKLTEEEVLSSMAERAQARKNKNFKRGDEIRSELAKKGIALMDVGKEITWMPRTPIQEQKLLKGQQGEMILSSSMNDTVLQQFKKKVLIRAKLTEEEVLNSMADKNFKSSEIISELAKKGIVLMDVGKEVTWIPRTPIQEQKLPKD